MKVRLCPACGLKFKGRARRLPGVTAVTCPRCGHVIEVDE